MGPQNVFSNISFPLVSTKIKLNETISCEHFLVVKLSILPKVLSKLTSLLMNFCFVSKSATLIIDIGEAYFAAFLSSNLTKLFSFGYTSVVIELQDNICLFNAV